MANQFHTWTTTKTENGYRFNVKLLSPSNEILPSGNYCETQIVKTGVCHSRAVAKSQAQKWVRHLNSKLA